MTMKLLRSTSAVRSLFRTVCLRKDAPCSSLPLGDRWLGWLALETPALQTFPSDAQQRVAAISCFFELASPSDYLDFAFLHYVAFDVEGFYRILSSCRSRLASDPETLL